MSTALVLGNQKLLVNINHKLEVSDLYFPHVGLENQLSNNVNTFYFRINGRFFDINENDWEISIRYESESMVGVSHLVHKETSLEVEIHDLVLQERRIYLRRFTLSNKQKNAVEVYVYFQNNFTLYENDIGDTVLWYPKTMSLVHYKKDRYIGIGSTKRIHQFTCAGSKDNNTRGAAPDLNTGELFLNAVSNGSVNSCISYKYFLEPNSTISSNYYIVAGGNYTEIEELTGYLKSKEDRVFVEETNAYWKEFSNRFSMNLVQTETKVDPKITDLYKRSLMIIQTQIDYDGAVVASNDGKYLKEGGKDTYSYLWPRDAANVISSLIEVGNKDTAEKYLHLASKLLSKDGYFFHKYYPYSNNSIDSIASSWHPWINKFGATQLPIQIDETALTLVLILQHFEKFRDRKYIEGMWDSFIFPMSNFLGNYRFTLDYDSETIEEYVDGFACDSTDPFSEMFIHSKLPRQTYDIWEERMGISIYTCSTVYAGLMAASKLAQELSKDSLTNAFGKYALEIKDSTIQHFFDPKLDRFISRFQQDDALGTIEADTRVDSSTCSLWQYGVLDVKDEMVEKNMDAIEERLSIPTNIGGIARKENDHYHQIDTALTGNPWFICTLWLAQYWFRRDDLLKGMKYLGWATEHADLTGLMAEQANPHTGIGESVKPLTWSHSEYVKTVNLLLRKQH